MIASRIRWVNLWLPMVVLALASCRAGPTPIKLPGLLVEHEKQPCEVALLVRRLRDQQEWVVGGERIEQRFTPASTTKIPHSLIAFEVGAVQTLEEAFEWDGVQRSVASWNRSQSFRDAFRNSTVWIFQNVVQRIGSKALRTWLRRFRFGNADIGAPEQLTNYWLRGPLQVSAREQVDFLELLASLRLPLSQHTYDLAFDMMIESQQGAYVLRAKSGWCLRDPEPDTGWYVGWLTKRAGDDLETYVFACNLDVTARGDLGKRQAIVRSALARIAALPLP